MNRALIAVGCICSLLWGLVTAMSLGLESRLTNFIDKITLQSFSDVVLKMTNGFYHDTPNHDMPTLAFLFVYFVIFGLVFFLIVKLEKSSTDNKTLGTILFFSILFRVILLPGELIHENDIYRYLWDGKSSIHGINPFKYAPADLFMYEFKIEDDYYDPELKATIKAKVFDGRDHERLNRLIALRDKNPTYYSRIGYREVPTIYPPVTQFTFMISSLIKQDSIFVMKLIFTIFDVGVIFIIIQILKHFGRDPCYSLIYAWSPLVLKEFPNSGHYDSIAIFFTMLGIYFYLKRKDVGTVFALAFGFLSKFFTIVILPLLHRCKSRGNFLIFLGIVTACYLPFLIIDKAGFIGVFSGLYAYGKEWAYNASIFSVVYACVSTIAPKVIDTFLVSKAIVGAFYLGILFWLYKQKETNDLNTIHQCFVAIAALFILSPVGDPWYFCWVMPFLCIFPYRSWIALSALLMVSYINFQTTFPIVYAKVLGVATMNWVVYVPFFLLLIIELLLKPKYLEKARSA